MTLDEICEHIAAAYAEHLNFPTSWEAERRAEFIGENAEQAALEGGDLLTGTQDEHDGGVEGEDVGA
jgi:hypothetical protein